MSKDDTPRALVPRLRFPEFRTSGAWVERPLGNYLEESRIAGSDGGTARKLTVKLWGKGVVEKNEAYQGSVSTKYYRRHAGQFIYSKLDFLNGAFGIIPEHLDGYESTVDLPCLDIDKGADPAFLLAFVARPAFYKQFGEIADGGRKAKRIQVEVLQSFPIAMPPKKAEQRKIAECLGSLDDLIAAEGRKLDALRDQKKGLTQRLFPREGETRPRLRFPEFRKAGEWEAETLGGIADISSGTTPARANPEYFEGGDIPWVKTSDLNNSEVICTEECVTAKAGARINPVGSVLVAMYGGFKQIGRTGILGLPAATNQAMSVLVVDHSRTLPVYVLTWLNARVDDWKRIASSSRKDPNVTGSDVARFQIRLPKKAEQHRIANCLASLDARIAAQAEKLDALRAHKRGLMQQLFPSPEEN